MAWRRPAWLTMNVWGVVSGIVMIIIALVGVYYAMPVSSSQESTDYTITVPGDADPVGLCLQTVRGNGQVPDEGSLWLVVHRIGSRDYYLVRKVQPNSDGDGWEAGALRIGNADSPVGQQYEVILWRLDPRVTDVVSHLALTEGVPVFSGPPRGVTAVAHTTVVRTVEKRSC